MWNELAHRFKYPGLTFALSFIVLAYFFHEVLFDPNNHLFASGGDGIKNYYTYIFHAKHDPNFWEFGGMNYPFYENVVYTDGHPLLASLVGGLGLENYAIGILNILLLLSFPICSVFLFLILRNYKVEVLWSILAAISITYLTPQILRFSGHLSLSYVFAIPGMWWLLIQCNNARSSTLWAILSFLYVIAFFFTHPYLGIILAFMCSFFWLFVYLFNRSEWKTAIGFFTVQVIIPFGVFRWLIFLTDHHYNRMDIPAGFYNYFAGWGSLFVPHHGPSAAISKMIGFRLNDWETWAYVGVTSMVFFLILLAYAIVKRKEISFKLLFKHELFIFVLAAYAILIFSFCFPFKFLWMRWFGDYIGSLKQFRILGRFAWIFFYVGTITLVVAYYHMYKRQGKNLVLAAVFFVGIAYYFVESHKVVSDVAGHISQADNTFFPENLSSELNEVITHVNTENYDAFMMLPFTHMSSENMMLLGEEKANFEAFMISYHTGKPMMNSVSSRMSIDESIKFNNFFGPEFCEKMLVYDLPEKARIAVIVNDNYLSKDELKIVYTHDYVYQNDVFSVMEFDRDAWNTDFYFNEMLQKKALAKNELKQGWKSEGNPWFYYNSWNEKKCESLKGAGGFHRKKMDQDDLVVLNADSLENGQYAVSFWYNYYVDRADIMTITEMTYNNGADTKWVDTDDIKQSTHIVGHWLHVEMNFEITDSTDLVRIYMSGNRSREPYIIDELLIRKLDDPALFSTGKIGGDEYIIYNNYWVKAESFSK